MAEDLFNAFRSAYIQWARMSGHEAEARVAESAEAAAARAYWWPYSEDW